MASELIKTPETPAEVSWPIAESIDLMLLDDVNLTASSGGPFIFYDRETSRKIDQLLREVAHAHQKIAENEARLTALERDLAGPEIIEVRDLSDADAKREIGAHFKKHHGEVFYPSDIAEAMCLDYDQVVRVLEELERGESIAET